MTCKSMDKRKKLRKELEQELQWIQYGEQVTRMRELPGQAKQKNFTSEELKVINIRLNNLAVQVRALDSESRKWQLGKYCNEHQ